MFGFLKRSLEYNKLATAFTKLYAVMETIVHDHEMSIGDDDEKLSKELTILAVWVYENVFKSLAMNNIALDETIYVHGFGGWKKIAYFMNGTVGQLIKLSVEAGIENEIQDILAGGLGYDKAKDYLKNNYG